MKKLQRNGLVITAAVLLGVTSAGSVHGHFVWLDSQTGNEQAQALLFFSEGPHEHDYHLPDPMANAAIRLRMSNGESRTLETKAVDSDEYVGLKSDVSGDGDFVLESTCQYGNYHGTLLTYFAKHIHCGSQDRWTEFPPSDTLKLEIMPAAERDGISCTVLWQGKPLSGAQVTVSQPGEEPLRKETNDDGKVAFSVAKSGTFGIYANHTDPTVQGEIDGEKYESATYFATLTLDYQPARPSAGTTEAHATSEPAKGEFPPLPKAIASFGAAVHDGWLYVYGGHTGRAHAHSSENLSPHFVRIKLDGGSKWEALPMQTPLQGLALVAHGDYLFRIGGMNARNMADEDDDLHSVAEFARFDPRSRKWTDLSPLPEPRSSHDAVVIGEILYVVGGWELSGPGHGQWHETAWSYDLSSDEPEWKPLPQPPFARRALAAAHWQGKLVVVCGMDADGDVSRAVDLYDPATGQWSSGPMLPGDGMHGFGIAAWNQNGKLYASGIDGQVLQLGDDGKTWIEAARLQKARFFHRLLPVGQNDLLAVAGASFEHGHLAETERIELAGEPQ